MTAARVRRPERHDPRYYEDTGCILGPSCLACPLPVCIHDVPGGFGAVRRVVRDAAIRQRRRDGDCVPDIAADLDVSARTVLRVVEGW